MTGGLGRVAVLAGACLAAGVAAGLAGGAAFILAAIAREPNAQLDWLAGLLVMSFIMVIYATAAMIVLGLPAHTVLTRQRLIRVRHYGTTGLAAGALLSLLLVPLLQDFLIVVIGAVTGAVGGVTFWSMARPDRRPTVSKSV